MIFVHRQAFKLFDSDGDGVITSEELRALIEKVARVIFIKIMIIVVIIIVVISVVIMIMIVIMIIIIIIVIIAIMILVIGFVPVRTAINIISIQISIIMITEIFISRLEEPCLRERPRL